MFRPFPLRPLKGSLSDSEALGKLLGWAPRIASIPGTMQGRWEPLPRAASRNWVLEFHWDSLQMWLSPLMLYDLCHTGFSDCCTGRLHDYSPVPRSGLRPQKDSKQEPREKACIPTAILQRPGDTAGTLPRSHTHRIIPKASGSEKEGHSKSRWWDLQRESWGCLISASHTKEMSCNKSWQEPGL